MSNVLFGLSMLIRPDANVCDCDQRPPEPPMVSGYQRLYFDHVLQADRGVDLDFLVGQRGAAVPREAH